MPVVKPFPALVYDPRLPRDEVLAPPYDAITPPEARMYAARSPYNVVRLILPETPRAAAETLERWCRKKILVPDGAPSFYWCRQAYDAGGAARREAGLIALLGLEGAGRNGVVPHEETNACVRLGQLELLRSVRANFTPIMVLYRDQAGAVEKIAFRLERSSPPFLEYRDDQGVVFSLWRLPPAPEITAFFASRRVFIADGHHRYGGALQHYLETGLASAGFAPAYFLNSATSEPVMSFHRFAPDAGRSAWLEIGARFKIRPVSDLDEVCARLKPGVLGVGHGNDYAVFPVETGGLPESVFLHREIIGPVLKLDDDQLVYEPSAARAGALLAGQGGLAFFLPPVAAGVLQRVWEQGVILPRKSTYFYPKIPSGLLIYRHVGPAA